MLKFEFVQNGEFDDPFYEVIRSDDCCVGEFVFINGEWKLRWTHHSSQNDLKWIYWKLDELNKSTKSQRILGVF